MLLDEAATLQRLRHPNVVQVIDVVVDRKTGIPRIMMELCAGTLRQLLQLDGDRLTFETRCSLCVDICEGMSAVHAAGLIHYDLKASNVLVSFHNGRPVAKISDLGCARSVNPATGFAPAWETPGMKRFPEVATAVDAGLSLECVTPALDVFSFGDVMVPSLFQPWLVEDTSGAPVSLCVSASSAPVSAAKEFLARILTSCVVDVPARRPTFRDLCAMFLPYTRFATGINSVECIRPV